MNLAAAQFFAGQWFRAAMRAHLDGREREAAAYLHRCQYWTARIKGEKRTICGAGPSSASTFLHGARVLSDAGRPRSTKI